MYTYICITLLLYAICYINYVIGKSTVHVYPLSTQSLIRSNSYSLLCKCITNNIHLKQYGITSS